MNRRTVCRSVRQAALTMALLCGLGAALATARAQVPPVEAPVEAPAEVPIAAPAVDAPAVDAPAVDAPAVDAPAVDAPAVDAPVGEADVVEPELPSPWSLGLVTATIAVAIGGISSVLGIWVHRNEDRPVSNAIAMTSLVLAASTVGIVQSYLDAVSGIRHDAELERMLDMVDEIALESGDPALAELVKSEGGASYSPAGRR